MIDCFTFNDEFDILDLRLDLLAPVVDKFVLVESNVTFSGKPKPLHFEHNYVRTNLFDWDRITHVIVDDMPDTENPWEREAHQRNAILRGLMEIRPDDDDLILISDVDEIPDPARLREFGGGIRDWLKRERTSAAFEQALYMYTLNWRHKRPWYGTRAVRWGDLQYPQALRSTLAPMPGELTVKGGGWSFSSFGGVEAVQRKVAAFSHQEVNTPALTAAAHVARCIREGRGLAPGQHDWCERVTDHDGLPEALRDRSRWPAVWFGEGL